MRPSELSDAALLAGIARAGGVTAFARELKCDRTAISKQLRRRTLTAPKAVARRPRAAAPAPKVTRESLHEALEPPNTCKVKVLLESLDDESRAVVEEALGYHTNDFTAKQLREWLLGLGFADQDTPGSDAILAHRAGRKPCRCKG
jgi:hypothetical protein